MIEAIVEFKRLISRMDTLVKQLAAFRVGEAVSSSTEDKDS